MLEVILFKTVLASLNSHLSSSDGEAAAALKVFSSLAASPKLISPYVSSIRVSLQLYSAARLGTIFPCNNRWLDKNGSQSASHSTPFPQKPPTH